MTPTPTERLQLLALSPSMRLRLWKTPGPGFVLTPRRKGHGRAVMGALFEAVFNDGCCFVPSDPLALLALCDGWEPSYVGGRWYLRRVDGGSEGEYLVNDSALSLFLEWARRVNS